MAGWELKGGTITEYNINEDRIWSLFNFVFSDSSRKRNTYKFGVIKFLLVNVFNGSRKNVVYCMTSGSLPVEMKMKNL